MKISIGDGLVGGSGGYKYITKNPIARFLINKFDRSLVDMVSTVSPNTILEIGCGEGHVTRILLENTQAKIHATEIIFSLLEETKAAFNTDRISWEVAKLENYKPITSYGMVVCCEVLEHLVDPTSGLQALSDFGAQWYLLSVPREPLFRILNIMRGGYLKDMGNSPGHIQHWSKESFIRLVSRYFDVLEVRSPIPWTMLLCRHRVV